MFGISLIRSGYDPPLVDSELTVSPIIADLSGSEISAHCQENTSEAVRKLLSDLGVFPDLCQDSSLLLSPIAVVSVEIFVESMQNII